MDERLQLVRGNVLCDSSESGELLAEETAEVVRFVRDNAATGLWLVNQPGFSRSVLFGALRQGLMVQDLVLASCGLTDDQLGAVVSALCQRQGMRSLRRLAVRDALLTPASFESLTLLLRRTTTKTLSINFNQGLFGVSSSRSARWSQGKREFLETVAEGRLERLEVDGTNVDNSDANLFADMIRRSNSLSVLLLGTNKDIGEEFLSAVIPAIRDNKSLRTLSFEYCSLHSSAAPLFELLCGDETRLTWLGLDGNDLGDAGLAGRVCQVLAQNPRLREITLTRNGFSDAELASISEAVSANAQKGQLRNLEVVGSNLMHDVCSEESDSDDEAWSSSGEDGLSTRWFHEVEDEQGETETASQRNSEAMHGARGETENGETLARSAGGRREVSTGRACFWQEQINRKVASNVHSRNMRRWRGVAWSVGIMFSVLESQLKPGGKTFARAMQDFHDQRKKLKTIW